MCALENGLRNFMREMPPQNMIGWFAIARSQELQISETKSFIYLNKELMITRNAQGKIENSAITEQNGIIYIWNHPKNMLPIWHLPCIDDTWTPFLYHQLTAMTHPQEVYENSIDQSHFAFVHHFKNLSLIEEPTFQDHNMKVTYRIRRKNIFLTSKWIDAYFKVILHGLGCAYNEIHIPALGISVKMLALTTPIQNGMVKIHIAAAIKLNKILSLLKTRIHHLIFKNIIHDFCQDVAIWENKCYRPRPLLVKGDGKIIQFREWCKQFYA